MTNQVNVWKGEFGDEYTDRNAINWRDRLEAFQAMVGELPVTRVLEIGCNQGHNLVALAHVFGKQCDLVGLDANTYALGRAHKAEVDLQVVSGNVLELPFKGAQFDLVFTAGLLIHLPLAELPKGISAIYNASGRYILAVEYWDEKETSIPYRGIDEMLWKRDFLQHYQSQFPDLELIGSGFWDQENGFDRSHWWLLEKGK